MVDATPIVDEQGLEPKPIDDGKAHAPLHLWVEANRLRRKGRGVGHEVGYAHGRRHGTTGRHIAKDHGSTRRCVLGRRHRPLHGRGRALGRRGKS
jgi:hypothetical protein